MGGGQCRPARPSTQDLPCFLVGITLTGFGWAGRLGKRKLPAPTGSLIQETAAGRDSTFMQKGELRGRV